MFNALLYSAHVVSNTRMKTKTVETKFGFLNNFWEEKLPIVCTLFTIKKWQQQKLLLLLMMLSSHLIGPNQVKIALKGTGDVDLSFFPSISVTRFGENSATLTKF